MNPEERKTTPKRSGFTLVELVVVIAILGILAGIGYVGYSGYIRYARRAADDEYIGAVNEALAAACQEAGVDHSKLGMNAATVSFRDMSNKDSTKTKLLSLSLPATSSQEKAGKKKASAINSFDHYFEGEKGNKEMLLKFYDPGNIVFEGNGQLFVAYEDPEAAKTAIWNKSGFSRDGAAEHLKDAAGALKNFLTSAKDSRIPNNTSIENALNSVDGYINISEAEKSEIIQYFADHNLSGDDLSREEIGNGLTAYIAHKTAEMAGNPDTRASLIDDIRNNDVHVDDDYKQHVNDYKNPLLEIPMQLAALEGYCNSGNASPGFQERFRKLREGYKPDENGNGTSGLQGLLDMASSGFSIFLPEENGALPDSNELEKFRAYKNSAQFETDMSAYLDVLERADGNISSSDPDMSDESFMEQIFGFLGG